MPLPARPVRRFTPAPQQLNQRITLQVTAKRSGYLTAVVTTDPTAAVRLGRIASLGAPTVVRQCVRRQNPACDPRLMVGGRCRASHTSGAETESRSAARPDGRTRPSESTAATSLRVRVTATADGYHDASKRSAAVPVLFGRVSIPDRPTISGDPVVGSRLVAPRPVPVKPVRREGDVPVVPRRPGDPRRDEAEVRPAAA